MATTSNLSIDNNNHKQKAYSINIHCANCAAKIERKINELSDVDNATISILTKQLTLTAKNPDELLPTIQKIADKIEPGTIISQLEENASNYKEKIYLIKNLDCANCGAKIEKKLNELAEINSAQLTFATKKLKIVAQNPDALLPQINKIANSIENGVKIINADDNLIKAVRSVVNLYPQAKLKVKKEKDLTINGYTKEFEAEIIREMEEIDKLRQQGKLKTYASVDEAFKAEGLI